VLHKFAKRFIPQNPTPLVDEDIVVPETVFGIPLQAARFD